MCQDSIRHWQSKRPLVSYQKALDAGASLSCKFMKQQQEHGTTVSKYKGCWTVRCTTAAGNEFSNSLIWERIKSFQQYRCVEVAELLLMTAKLVSVQ